MTPTRRRIGILGGSFDPAHVGHLSLARTAADHLGLGEVRWFPAGHPWQKMQGPQARQLAPAPHRAAMAEMLAAEDPRFMVDRREMEGEGPTYTSRTVRRLLREFPDADLFLILGQDQYARLDTWHAWRDLVVAVTLAVAPRAGAAVRPSPALAQVWHRLELLPMPRCEVSSTAIRAHLAAGGRAAELVPAMLTAPVAGYIDLNQLYRVPPFSSPHVPPHRAANS